jgi:hypothetical protein
LSIEPFSHCDTFLVNNKAKGLTGTESWMGAMSKSIAAAFVNVTRRGRDESRAVFEARAVFSHQHPLTMTPFDVLPKFKSADMLPNGSAIVDSLGQTCSWMGIPYSCRGGMSESPPSQYH